MLTRKEGMDCKEFEKQIPAFIARKMDYPTLKSFHAHIEKCEDCKEELVIQFLATEGIQRLEDGSAFDLQSELDARLAETEHKIKFHSGFVYLGFAMEVIAVCMIFGVLIWILL